VNEGELRAHLAARHPGVRLTSIAHPDGRPAEDLVWAHDAKHERFPGDQDHSHAAGDSGGSELSIEAAARQHAVTEALANKDGMTFAEIYAEVWEHGREFGRDEFTHGEEHFGTEPDCLWCAARRAEDARRRMGASRNGRTCVHCGAGLHWRPGPHGDEWVDDDNSYACRNVPMPTATASVVLHEPKEEQG
jgi:hypothetical protein